MNPHLILCEDLIRKMAVPGYPNLYILGLFAKRVTVRSQQVRALNLIHALAASNRIHKDSRVLVVGAGFAGLTAAASAVRRKCNVKVIDRAQSRLTLQRNCHHRFLHPHIHTWPASGSLDKNARLPILNWQANYARDVVAQIEAQLVDFTSVGLEEQLGVGAVTILTDGTAGWRYGNANIKSPFDAIILAIGFGSEEGEASYWGDIPLDLNKGQEANMKVLVSGGGDGALTDLMRACLLNYRQDEILYGFANAPNIEIAKRRVAEIEKSLESNDAALLSRHYENSALDLGIDLPRRAWKVFWAPGSDKMFGPSSSPLNRFITAQLFHAGAFEPLLGHGTTDRVVGLRTGGYEVTFSHGHSDSFNVVVQRHGPRPTFGKDFPSIEKASEALREMWQSTGVDWTGEALLEEHIAPLHSGFSQAADPSYREDVKNVLESDYRISSIANRETIIVVIGTGLWQELLDRKAAQVVQAAVNEAGDGRFRRAIVLPYSSWKEIPELHENPVVSVGGPIANDLTKALKDKNAYKMASDVFGSWQLHFGMPRVALWGKGPGETLTAVEEYVRRPEGLQAFIRQSWK